MADDHTPIRSHEATGNATTEAHLKRVLELVRQSLTDLRFGQVILTVQDGLVVQIERTEKMRLR